MEKLLKDALIEIEALKKANQLLQSKKVIAEKKATKKSTKFYHISNRRIETDKPKEFRNMKNFKESFNKNNPNKELKFQDFISTLKLSGKEILGSKTYIYKK